MEHTHPHTHRVPSLMTVVFLFGGQKVYRHFFSQDRNVESYSSKDIEVRRGRREGGGGKVEEVEEGGEERERCLWCRLSTLLEFLFL